MNEEDKQKKYFMSVFGKDEPSKKKIRATLDRAHEIRKFEISLYWQRSLFFWGFVAALLVAFGVTLTKTTPTIFSEIMAFCIAFLGLFVSFGWFYVEKGSKSWQINWEKHIDFLEYRITGHLYKTVIGKRGEFFSVSKVTQSIISAFIIFWFFASIFTAANILCHLKGKTNCFIECLDNWVYWFPILSPLVVYFFVKHLNNKAWKTKLSVTERPFPDIENSKER